MCTPMHEVLAPTPVPGHPSTGSLYIGSFSAVQDRDMLRENRITHLVQVLDVPWLPVSEKDGFSTHRISIDDAITVDIRPHLEAACNYIDSSLRSGRNVLVHCQQVCPIPGPSMEYRHSTPFRVSHAVQLSYLRTSSVTVE